MCECICVWSDWCQYSFRLALVSSLSMVLNPVPSIIIIIIIIIIQTTAPFTLEKISFFSSLCFGFTVTLSCSLWQSLNWISTLPLSLLPALCSFSDLISPFRPLRCPKSPNSRGNSPLKLVLILLSFQNNNRVVVFCLFIAYNKLIKQSYGVVMY